MILTAIKVLLFKEDVDIKKVLVSKGIFFFLNLYTKTQGYFFYLLIVKDTSSSCKIFNQKCPSTPKCPDTPQF